MTPEALKELITNNIDAQGIEVNGDGSKFEVEIISSAFEGLSTIKRHQLVYKITNPYISTGEIHALTIRAHTPAEKPAE